MIDGACVQVTYKKRGDFVCACWKSHLSANVNSEQ